MIRSISRLALLAALAALPATAQEDHGGHGDEAHVHGAARLFLSVDGGLVTATLTLPGGDLLGRDHDEHGGEEHAGEGDHDDEDHAGEHAEDHADPAEIRAEADALFAETADFLALPEAAGCALEGRETMVTVIEEGEHDGHADVIGSWSFTCAEPGALDSVTIAAFEHTTLEEIDAIVLVDGIGRTLEVTPGTATVEIAPQS